MLLNHAQCSYLKKTVAKEGSLFMYSKDEYIYFKTFMMWAHRWINKGCYLT